MNETAQRVLRSIAAALVCAAIVVLVVLFSGGGTRFIYIAF